MVTRVSSGRRAYIALGVVLASVASVALAATFNLFSPASGILKGNPSTYVTTAATGADVVATFSGTCNSSTFLRGDGSCNSPPATGVTSVGLTMPSGFSVSGSPVTSSGTLGVTTTLNGNLRGNGSGFVVGNVALGSEVSGTLPVGNGGIGVGTLTGIAKGNGTSAFTAAVASDVYGLWAGGCSSSNFLRGDGTCASPGGGGTVTSIAAGTGISASPGSPITSSGTLSVDQSFSPTWTGTQTFATNILASGSRDIGSTGTRFVNVYATNLCDGACGTAALADSTGTTARFANGSSWTAIALPHNTTVTGSLNATAGLTSFGNFVYTTANNASALINGVAGCSVTAANGVSSCSRGSTGTYTVTIAGISTAKCNVTVDQTSATPVRIGYTHVNSFTSIGVVIGDAAGNPQDATFQFVCW